MFRADNQRHDKRQQHRCSEGGLPDGFLRQQKPGRVDAQPQTVGHLRELAGRWMLRPVYGGERRQGEEKGVKITCVPKKKIVLCVASALFILTIEQYTRNTGESVF